MKQLKYIKCLLSKIILYTEWISTVIIPVFYGIIHEISYRHSFCRILINIKSPLCLQIFKICCQRIFLMIIQVFYIQKEVRYWCCTFIKILITPRIKTKIIHHINHSVCRCRTKKSHTVYWIPGIFIYHKSTDKLASVKCPIF